MILPPLVFPCPMLAYSATVVSDAQKVHKIDLCIIPDERQSIKKGRVNTIVSTHVDIETSFDFTIDFVRVVLYLKR